MELIQKPVVALGISIVLGVGGQFFFKAAATRDVFYRLFGFDIGFFLLGGCVYFISLLAYVYSLRAIPLHIAYASISLGYIIVYLIEVSAGLTIQLQNLIAILFILVGVFLLWR